VTSRCRGAIVAIVLMVEPDETCPGLWVELDVDVGYCDLGDQCRNPKPEAHERRVAEWVTGDEDDAS
jgi:hypothetical protein